MWTAAVRQQEDIISDPQSTAAQKSKAEAGLDRLKKSEWMCEQFEQIKELAHMLGSWSNARVSLGKRKYAVSTGGGPGMMEAANSGASKAGADTVGFGISLPFEAGLNPSVSAGLAFEFHYFFTRKFLMMQTCRALVVAPGGFGTCDELFEALTLIQTGKQPDMPIVMFGKNYWSKIINWEMMVECGTISATDMDRLFMTDSVEDACKHIVEFLENREALLDGPTGPTPMSPCGLSGTRASTA